MTEIYNCYTYSRIIEIISAILCILHGSTAKDHNIIIFCEFRPQRNYYRFVMCYLQIHVNIYYFSLIMQAL